MKILNQDPSDKFSLPRSVIPEPKKKWVPPTALAQLEREILKIPEEGRPLIVTIGNQGFFNLK